MVLGVNVAKPRIFSDMSCVDFAKSRFDIAWRNGG